MQVNLKVIKPFGAVLILVLSIAVTVMFFKADLHVPKPYISEHDTEYYAQSYETMCEMLDELKEHVFPQLGMDIEAFVSPDAGKVIIRVSGENHDKVRAVILRDFSEELFEFEKIP